MKCTLSLQRFSLVFAQSNPFTLTDCHPALLLLIEREKGIGQAADPILQWSGPGSGPGWWEWDWKVMETSVVKIPPRGFSGVVKVAAQHSNWKKGNCVHYVLIYCPYLWWYLFNEVKVTKDNRYKEKCWSKKIGTFGIVAVWLVWFEMGGVVLPLFFVCLSYLLSSKVIQSLRMGPGVSRFWV